MATGPMTTDEIDAFVQALGGVLVLRPQEGDGTPEVAWGDLFFYEAPDGVLPPGQPFATVVTKDYPGEPSSDLDRPGAFRVNVHVGRAALDDLVDRPGGQGVDVAGAGDPTARDVVLRHPVYGDLGWAAVVEPGERTRARVEAMLRQAHADARTRRLRRS